MLIAESYFIYFLQACFTHYRNNQGVDNIWLEKIKSYLLAKKQSIISSQLTFFTNCVTNWQCGDNEHSSPEKENNVFFFFSGLE